MKEVGNVVFMQFESPSNKETVSVAYGYIIGNKIYLHGVEMAYSVKNLEYHLQVLIEGPLKLSYGSYVLTK